MMNERQLIALMATLLEAGDRAAQREQKQPAQYVFRALNLFNATGALVVLEVSSS